MTASTLSPGLLDLARAHGVSTEYWDWQGNRVQVDADTLVAVLGALGVDASNQIAIGRELKLAAEQEWRRTLPPSIVMRQGWTPWVFVHVPHGSRVRLEAELEDGTTRILNQIENWVDPRDIDGVLTGRATFGLPGDLPLGWHRVHAWIEPGEAAESNEQTAPTASATLIVTPARLSTAPATDETKRLGVMTQAYQLRSADSWGIGDIGDVSALAQWGVGHGADFVLVNPFHAPAPVSPIEPSPYLPTTRRFIDPLLIRVDDVAGAADLDPASVERLEALAANARALNAVDGIDRDAAWAAKREALALLMDANLDDPERGRVYGDFCEREGQPLVDFATYCALADEFGADWTNWPTQFAHPTNPEVAAYREANAERVDFYRWLQWLIEGQLKRAQHDAVEAGMSLGIIHDLAVGVHPSGADAWALPDVLACGVTGGAPPDQFNQLGQNWSQPPWRPDRLAEHGYAPYRDMLRRVLQAAGGIRVDHILGLFRFWWIPAGHEANRGTYVRYDDEALVGILALEAERAGALVIGEDMGVVEPRTRDVMRERGIDGTSVLWFEWGEHGEPLAPEAYRHACLSSVTTHDLPPTAGYLALDHVRLREQLGLLTVPVEDEIAREQGVIATVVNALRDRGLVGDAPSERDIVLALHAWLAASASRLVGVAVADLVQDRRSVNQPGTYREYPNWCVPLSDANGALVDYREALQRPEAAELMRAARR